MMEGMLIVTKQDRKPSHTRAMRSRLIAAAEQRSVWQAGLEQHGIQVCAEQSDECQLILVDERCSDYPAQLARLNERPERPPLFFLVTNGA